MPITINPLLCFLEPLAAQLLVVVVVVLLRIKELMGAVKTLSPPTQLRLLPNQLPTIMQRALHNTLGAIRTPCDRKHLPLGLR